MSRSFNFLKLICFNSAPSSLATGRKLTENIFHSLKQKRTMCINIQSTVGGETEDEKKKKRKTVRIPQITLLSPDNSMSVTTLENAQKLAKRRNFELIKVSDVDNKTDRETYKLVNSGNYGDEEIEDVADSAEKTTTVKTRKLFIIHSKIKPHDLQIKTKNINKLLSKNFGIQITLSHDDSNWENVLNRLKHQLEGQIQQVIGKGTKTVLMINPLSVETKLSSANPSQGKKK